MEQLIKFETAKLAKEKGFNGLCDYSYEGIVLSKTYKSWRNSDDRTEYAVPTQSSLQKWLREEHNIHIMIFPSLDLTEYYVDVISKEDRTFIDNPLDTYEEALEIGLFEALELIDNS